MIRHLATLIICFAIRADVWAIVPRDGVLRESVATIETNSYYDSEGRLVFVQLIFLDAHRDGSESIVAWRMAKDETHVVRRDWDGGYRVVFTDSDRVREVRTNSVRETWTMTDRELESRESLPPEKRRGLSRGEGQ